MAPAKHESWTPPTALPQAGGMAHPDPTSGLTADPTANPTTGLRTGPVAGEWLTITEAADRLGVRPAAIRSRIKRKTVRIRPGKASNDGLVRVWIESISPRAGPITDPRAGFAAGHEPALVTGSTVEEIARLRTEVAVLTAKLEAAEKRAQGIEVHATERLADRDDQIDQLRTDAERERADHRAELDRLAAAHATELGRLQELLNRLTAPWWRRWFQH